MGKEYMELAIVKLIKNFVATYKGKINSRLVKCLFYTIYCFIQDGDLGLGTRMLYNKISIAFNYNLKHKTKAADELYDNVTYDNIYITFQFILSKIKDIENAKDPKKIANAIDSCIFKYHKYMHNYQTIAEQKNHLNICYLAEVK